MTNQAEMPAADAAEPILAVNNIEVIYDHVILRVLKGVSLSVPAAAWSRFWAPTGPAKNDDAQGDLQPAPRRARRGDEGLDRPFEGEQVQVHVGQRAGAAAAASRSWKGGAASPT